MAHACIWNLCDPETEHGMTGQRNPVFGNTMKHPGFTLLLPWCCHLGTKLWMQLGSFRNGIKRPFAKTVCNGLVKRISLCNVGCHAWVLVLWELAICITVGYSWVLLGL